MSNSIEQKIVNVDKILLKRGNLEENSTYVGALGELTFDTDLRTARVHDGITPGGDPLPTQSNVDATVLTSLSAVDGNIIPSVDSVYDLGSPEFQWNSLHVSGNIVFHDNSVQTTAFTGHQPPTLSSNVTIVTNASTVEYDCSSSSKFYHISPAEPWDADFSNIAMTANTSSTVAVYIEQGVTPFLPANISVNGNAVPVTWTGNLAGNSDSIDVLNFTVMNISGNIRVLGWSDVLFFLSR